MEGPLRLALVLPPLTQLHTPTPGPAYLARFLRAQGIASTQWDLGLELVLRALSRPGLTQVMDALQARAEDEGPGLPEPAWQALALREQHLAAVEPVVRFLQGRDRTLAGPTAPPQGLVFVGPVYPASHGLPPEVSATAAGEESGAATRPG